MNERHRDIVEAVKTAIREGNPRIHIQDDKRVADICACFKDDEGNALKRPDLMYETSVQKKGRTKRFSDRTETTCPWSWEGSLERAYMKKLEKYEPIRMKMQQECD
jgi:hypothetical protein